MGLLSPGFFTIYNALWDFTLFIRVFDFNLCFCPGDLPYAKTLFRLLEHGVSEVLVFLCPLEYRDDKLIFAFKTEPSR